MNVLRNVLSVGEIQRNADAPRQTRTIGDFVKGFLPEGHTRRRQRMSVIVTGIDMPKNCVCCNDNGIREILDCKLIFSGCANCGRHPYCPLKNVDGLIEKLNECADDKSTGEQVGIDFAIEIIKDYCGERRKERA